MSKAAIVFGLVATVLVVSLTVIIEILSVVAGWGILFGRVDVWKFLAMQEEETQLVLAFVAMALIVATGIICWMVISAYVRRGPANHSSSVLPLSDRE